MTLFAEERKNSLVEYINEKRRVTVADLCREFSVSSATMRNDLRDLDEAGLITRTHGGAIQKSRTGHESKIDYRIEKNRDEKASMALTAFEYIDDGDTIILDTGTTILELAKLLNQRKGLTVVTNDLKIGAELENHPDCEVLILGGSLRKGFHCTVGPGAFSFLKELSVDKAFMGANSFSMKKGASTPDLAQSEIKSKMIDIAAQVIILCDHTKIETDSLINFAQPNQIDLLITDSLSPEIRQVYEDLEIAVRTVR